MCDILRNYVTSVVKCGSHCMTIQITKGLAPSTLLLVLDIEQDNKPQK